MITLDLPVTDRRLYMPEDLSECTGKQYAQISELIYKLQQKQIDYPTFRIHAVYLLLDLKVETNENIEYQEEKMSNIHALSILIDNFFEETEQEGVKNIKQYYVHNPIKYICPRISRCYGPTDHFANMQFGEYIDALNFFSEYHHTNDRQFLYLLMATLYRKKRFFSNANGDKRKAYNPHTVEKRAKKFRLLYFGQVYGFYLLFASFQKYLVSSKIYWEGKELDLSILFKKNNEPTSDIPGIGLKSTLYTLAESGVFGTMKELKQESFWEVMLRMYDLTKRDLDNKAKEKELKSKTKRQK